MKTLRGFLVFLGAVLAGRVDAAIQATETVQRAVQQLVLAGNYTWVETRTSPARRADATEVYSQGAAVIDGFTVATITGVPVVAFEQKLVVQTETGWQRMGRSGMSPAELRALQTRVPGAPPPRAMAFFRDNPTPVHDLLRWFIRNAADLREQDGAIVGEVPAEDEQYLLGRPTPKSSRLPDGVARRAEPNPARADGTLSVWLEGGKLVRFTVEFSTAGTRVAAMRGGGGGMQRYSFEFSQIGTTKVQVPAEARAALEK